MYKYNVSQLNELEEYKKAFPNQDNIIIIYDLVKTIIDTTTNKQRLLRKEIISRLAKSYGISEETIYYLQKKYQIEGVTGLLTAKEIVVLFLQQNDKPLSYWNKRLLQEYVNKQITLFDIELQVEISLTLCGEILKELKSQKQSIKVESLNSYKGNTFIFLDYFKMMNQPNSLSRKIHYCFMILWENDFTILDVPVDRGKKLKYENEVFIGFEKVMKHLEKEEFFDYETWIILRNTRQNKIIMDAYNTYDENAHIVLSNIRHLEKKQKDLIKKLSRIRKELLANPQIVKSAYSRKRYIAKNRI
jgi:hypothetical protein